MNQPTVTLPISEYEGMKKQIEQLKKESVNQFVIREYTSLAENKYTLTVDKDKLLGFIQEDQPAAQIIFRPTPASLYEEPEQPLLSITLQDETSVPNVIYKGEEIKFKRHIQLDWETDSDIMGGLSYSIEHSERGKGYPVTNRIERRVKGHI